MRRFLLLCLLALLPIVSFAQKAQIFEVAPYEFEIIGDNSVALVRYNYDKEPNPETTELVIPEEVIFENKNYKVTTIDTGRPAIPFSWFAKNKQISSVVIPYSVTKIGKYAFSRCDKLRYIEIISPKIELSNYVFYDCENLCLLKINSDYLSMASNIFMMAIRKTSKLNEIQVKAAVRPYVIIEDNKFNPKPLITIIDEPQQTAAPTNTYIVSTPALRITTT